MVGKDYKHANKYQTMSLDKRGVLTCWRVGLFDYILQGPFKNYIFP